MPRAVTASQQNDIYAVRYQRVERSRRLPSVGEHLTFIHESADVTRVCRLYPYRAYPHSYIST